TLSSNEAQLSLPLHFDLNSVGRSSLGERRPPLVGPPHRADAHLQRHRKAIIGLTSQALNSRNTAPKHILIHQQGEDPRAICWDRRAARELKGLALRRAARRSARAQWTRARWSR